MVNVFSRRCSYDICLKRATSNVEGSKPAVYCKQHASDDMVDTHTRRCSHDTCTKKPLWGVLSGGMATACSEHKGEVLVGQLISFRIRCHMVDCCRMSRWGLSGRQPSHCHQH
ncbi:unnamed protein product, partial [Scytosiphon promiscuus]